jgi:hypothetical protein
VVTHETECLELDVVIFNVYYAYDRTTEVITRAMVNFWSYQYDYNARVEQGIVFDLKVGCRIWRPFNVLVLCALRDRERIRVSFSAEGPYPDFNHDLVTDTILRREYRPRHSA